MNPTTTYEFIDSGNGRKLERFDKIWLNRPAAQAIWSPKHPPEVWQKARVIVEREDRKTILKKDEIPDTWITTIDDIKFKVALTDFGHIGIFPEQRSNWDYLYQQIQHWKKKKTPQILNLFAYSGGSTLACARAGATVTHLDASKGMVSWARENARLNGLEQAPIRWIVDDALKFTERELRRGVRYDGIILDPPTYGRGKQNEVFKIEEHLLPLLHTCKALLSETPLFILLSCHTPGYTPLLLEHVLKQSLEGKNGHYLPSEMQLIPQDPEVFSLPNGTQCLWLQS
jgi:23S rRNA (cytosine1962-C5)-methyltransferase